MEKKGNDKSPNTIVNKTVNKLIGITIFNGLIIILKANNVKLDIKNFLTILNINLI